MVPPDSARRFLFAIVCAALAPSAGAACVRRDAEPATPQGGAAHGDAPSAGLFVWHELATTDPDAAARFYSAVLGWHAEANPDNPHYTLLSGPHGRVAGVTRLSKGAPRWAASVGGGDVDALVKLAREQRGKVLVEPADLPGTGRIAQLVDPAGAFFDISKPEGGPGPADVTAPGAFSWHELAAPDGRAELGFYHAVFGWDALDQHDVGAAVTYLMFGQGGKALGGIYSDPSLAGAEWRLYAHVDDLDEALARAKAAGGTVVWGPSPTSDGRNAQIKDPQGAKFGLSGPAAKGG